MSPVTSAVEVAAAAGLLGQQPEQLQADITSNSFFSGRAAVTAAQLANGYQAVVEQSPSAASSSAALYSSSALSSAFTLSSPPMASSFSSSSSSYHLPSSLTLALFTSPGTSTEPSTLSSSTFSSSSTVGGGGGGNSFTSSTSSFLLEAAKAASSSMHSHHSSSSSSFSAHHHHPSSSSSANITSSLFSLAATTASTLTTAHLNEEAPLLTYHRDSPLSLAASSVLLLNESSLLVEGDDSTLFDNLDASLTLSMNRGILMAIILGAISLFTIIGNLMVIWAIFNYRPLHNVQNMFMVSLAVADIAVAVLVMPLNVAYNLAGRWMFGLHLCEMWLTSDVLCCTASILNLCAIALDRYWAIHDPINYAQKRTMNRVCTSIGAVWILSAIISIPPLIGWNDWPESFDEDTPCKLSEEKSYLIYSSSGSFYIPLLIMTVVYFKIFKATRRRLKARAKASAMANLGRAGAAGAAGGGAGGGGSHLANTTTISTANLNTAAATTTIVNHKEHITKSSSNDDSSSSGSPKAVYGSKFGNFKSRCIRCCRSSSGSSGSKTGDKGDKRNGGRSSGGGSGSSKAFHKGKHQNSLMKNKEARIEIESASDDLDHSHNEGSSSDAANGEVEVLVASCPSTNGQFGSGASGGGGCGSQLINELAATRVPGGLDDTAGSSCSCPCNSTTAAPGSISNGQHQHCSALLNNGSIDCKGSNNSNGSASATLPSVLHPNGGSGGSTAFCSAHHPGSALLPTSASTGSASAALSSQQQQQQQIAYVCSCSSSGGKTSALAAAHSCSSEEASAASATAVAGQEDERRRRQENLAKTTQVELAGSSDQNPFTAAGDIAQQRNSEINGLVNNCGNASDSGGGGGGHICIASVNSPISLLSPMATTSTTLVPYGQTGSIASVSNMNRPELSSSTAITMTALSLSKTVIIPSPSANSSTPNAPGQTISVKKMWEERQKISLSRERRATRILGIVMGVFVACWAPFFIYYLKPLICDSCSMPHEVENFIVWLGYINSALNPLIYCGFNRDFRRAFQRILSCKKV